MTSAGLTSGRRGGAGLSGDTRRTTSSSKGRPLTVLEALYTRRRGHDPGIFDLDEG
jgi:hypothetical protein